MTRDNIKPVDALEACFALSGLGPSGPHRGTPGEIVKRVGHANPKLREALQNLTAEDIQDVRVETFLDPVSKR